MNTVIEIINAQTAKKYLEENKCNRPIKQRLVDQYAADMKAGNWGFTHQGIAFSADGTLLDGQHRLEAVVLSNAKIKMVVTRGVDSSVQLVMDDHAKRTAGDALSLIRGEKITARYIAAIRAAVELTSKRARSVQPLTKQELNNVFDTFKPAVDFVLLKMQSNEKGTTSAPVIGAITLAWFYVKDLARLESFCKILCGSMPEGEDDKAAKVLREFLLKTGMQATSQRQDGFLKTQRAIVAFCNKERITRVHATEFFFKWPLQNPVRTI
jgi:hypothetical protein